MKSLTKIILIAFLACNGGGTGPSPPPPPPPTTTTTTIPEIPRVDEWFTWDNYFGFSSFAAFRLDAGGIRALFNQSMFHGWTTPRVCAETEFWPDTPKYPRVIRDLVRVRSFLETVATIPGAQVLLMPNCTLKHGGLGWEEQRQWNKDVAKIAADFKNVAIEVVNEPWHHGHFFYRKGGLVRQLIREALAEGVLEVGADDAVCRDGNIRHELLNTVTFPSFHPCRNIGDNIWDPGRGYLQRLVDANGGLAVLTETVAWDDDHDQCDHFLRTCDQARIQSLINRCNRVPGCKINFHSEDGLASPSQYSWFPMAR